MRDARLFLILLCALTCSADTFTGVLDPSSGNAHLTTWDQYLPGYVPPIAGPTDAERAFNVAVYSFPISAGGPVRFSSDGYGMGGFDSVLSVFEGTGDAASYIYHQYSPFAAGDFSFDLNLAAGVYTLAIGMTFNEPCAAGFCLGAGATFGDGFTNLVNFDPSRPNPLFYSVAVTGTAVPETATGALTVIGAAAILSIRRFTRSRRS